MTDYHVELMSLSASYGDLDAAKRAVRTATADTYTRPTVVLGDALAYSNHYSVYFRPIVADKGRFLDMGCAPGGLCHMLLGVGWDGVGVTLSPSSGGLRMEVAKEGVLTLRYADVMNSDEFVLVATDGLAKGTFDLVNMGIVVDKSVREKSEGVASYSDQIYTQLRVGLSVMKPSGGTLMMALVWDFTTLPEVFQTLDALRAVSTSVRVMPTMYTASHARKQMYVAACGCCMTDSLCQTLRTIWGTGAERRCVYGKKRPADIEAMDGTAARECVKRVYATSGADLDAFCAILATALRRIFIH